MGKISRMTRAWGGRREGKEKGFLKRGEARRRKGVGRKEGVFQRYREKETD